MFGGPEVTYHQSYSARDWLSILRTPYPTQNLQRKHRTDHRHIRQDRRIQTELASALSKNATKTSPFENIPLQTTGKENSWQTKEVGEISCNPGDGTDQRVQSLMFMIL
jgi:hypothetical protein